MPYNLFLDDEREPWMVGNYIYPVELRKQYRLEEWVVVRNYLEFVKCVEERGLPVKVSFDHDIGDTVLHNATDENGVTDYDSIVFNPPLQKTGFHCARWMLRYCRSNDYTVPECFVHSANVQGAENIRNLLNVQE